MKKTLYQVAYISYDTMDNYMFTQLYPPTTDEDKAIADYEQEVRNKISECEELKRDGSIEWFNVNRKDGQATICICHNGSIEDVRILFRIYEVEV